LAIMRGVYNPPPLAEMFRDYFRLLLLTGQRRNEVAGMAWDEIRDLDGDDPRWEIPGERTKNHRDHIVPLAPAVVTILRRRWEAQRKQAQVAVDTQSGREKARAKSKLVLSGTGETPLSGFSRAKVMLDKRVAALCKALRHKPLPPWRVHDLRRTAVTDMNEMGTAPHIVEAVVNHVSGAAKAGVAGVYNRALYLAERRAALEAWAEKVTALSN
jgi:integrase